MGRLGARAGDRIPGYGGSQLSSGRVVIFQPAEGNIPRGLYKAGIETAKLLLFKHPI